MNNRILRYCILLAASLLLAMAAAPAQAQSVPGDSYLAPLNIPLNSSKTATNIQLATLQGAIENVTCDPDLTSNHSVWFSFMLPSSAEISLDTYGSYYEKTPGVFSTRATLTLFEKSGPSLIEEACNNGVVVSSLFVAVNPGDYVVRVAVEPAAPITISGTGQLRLNLRAMVLGQWLDDPDFSESPIGNPWKIKKAGTPAAVARICPLACHVQFTGVAGGTLEQKITFSASQIKMKAGDYFSGRAYINNTPAPGANVKLQIQIKYSNGLPPTKATRVANAVFVGTGGGVWVTSAIAEIQSKAVQSVTFKIISPAATDTFNVVDTLLSLYSGGVLRGTMGLGNSDSQPLALPAALR